MKYAAAFIKCLIDHFKLGCLAEIVLIILVDDFVICALEVGHRCTETFALATLTKCIEFKHRLLCRVVM